MKKIFLIVFVLALAFVVVERQRVFVRDPLAKVVRDGVKEEGVQVYINYSNDVLLENDRAPLYVELIQQGQPVGAPKETGCVHWLVCLLDAYPATLEGKDEGAVVEGMDSKTVRFREPGGKEAVVSLR